jgi:hypothetical protein
VSSVPNDIIKAAMIVAVEMEVHGALGATTRAKGEMIAAAIAAERERCLALTSRFALQWGTSSRDIDVAMQSAAKQDAAFEIGQAIQRGYS